MDDGGNIMIKRVSKSNVYVKEISGGDNSSVSSEIIRNNGLLELEKPVKVTDQTVAPLLTPETFPQGRALRVCSSKSCLCCDFPTGCDCDAPKKKPRLARASFRVFLV